MTGWPSVDACMRELPQIDWLAYTGCKIAAYVFVSGKDAD